MIKGDSIVTTNKTCSRCGRNKPILEYHRKGFRFHSACKKCVSIKKKSVYRSNNRSQMRKGIRQIQLEELKIDLVIYTGELPNQTAVEHINLLRTFVLEDVICNENRIRY
jgi:ribosomal protein S27AE